MTVSRRLSLSGDACRLADIRKAILLEVSLGFVSFDDLWRPFLGGSTGEAAFARELNHNTGGALEKQLRQIIEAKYGGGNSYSRVVPGLSRAS